MRKINFHEESTWSWHLISCETNSILGHPICNRRPCDITDVSGVSFRHSRCQKYLVKLLPMWKKCGIHMTSTLPSLVWDNNILGLPMSKDVLLTSHLLDISCPISLQYFVGTDICVELTWNICWNHIAKPVWDILIVFVSYIVTLSLVANSNNEYISCKTH